MMEASGLKDTLIEEIDFAPWIFGNEQRDGLYELAKTDKDFQPDGFHPGDATYRKWAQIVSDRLPK